jgi:hypothetical protein
MLGKLSPRILQILAWVTGLGAAPVFIIGYVLSVYVFADSWLTVVSLVGGLVAAVYMVCFCTWLIDMADEVKRRQASTA